jgi:hypothetical protein
MCPMQDKPVIPSSDVYYFTCPSYGFISLILSIIEEIPTVNPQITIIVFDDQMRSFWCQLTANNRLNWTILLLQTKIPGRFRHVRSWMKIRPTVNRLFKDHFLPIRHSCFVCCGSANDVILFSLIKRIAPHNVIIFLDIAALDTPALYNVKSLILLLHTWIFYKLDVTIRNVAGQPSIFLSSRFFTNRNIRHHKLEYYYNADLLRKYNPVSASLTHGIKLLWLDDDSLTYSRPLRHEIHVCLRALKRIVDSHFAKHEVLYKRHPNPGFHSREFKSIYADYAEFPSHISADFIFTNSGIQYILGGLSVVLSTAARNSDMSAISYAKLIPYEDEDYKRQVIELRVQDSDQKIVFLDSVDEFQALLSKGGANK